MNKREQEAKMVREMLESFARLEQKATDEVGWIALKFSCSREKAEKMIGRGRQTRTILRCY